MKEFFTRTYRYVHESEEEFRDRYAFRDLSLVFSDTPDPVFVDWCHTGEDANAKIARIMAKDILEKLSAGRAQ